MANSEITFKDSRFPNSSSHRDYRRKVTEIEPSSQVKLQETCALADQILMKKYLVDMHQYEIVPFPSSEMKSSISDNVRMFQLNRLIYDKEENNQEKLLNVYNALYNCGGSVILMICSTGNKVNFYIGTKSLNKKHITTCQNVLERALKGNFSGTEISNVLREKDVSDLMKTILYSDNSKHRNKSIASITSMAGFRDGHTMRSGDFVQGMEKLADAMRGEKYTLMIIADPVQQAVMETRRIGYESLYNQLSSFVSTTLSFGQNESEAISNSISESFSTGITNSIALTTSHSYSKGISNSTSDTVGESDTVGKSYSIGASLNGGQSSSQSVTTSKSVSGSVTIIPKIFTLGGSLAKAVGEAVGVSVGASASAGYTWSTSHTESKSHTDAYSISNVNTDTKGETSSKGKTETKTNTTGKTNTQTLGQSITYTQRLENRYVKTLLERIDKQLARIDECMDVGMWDCAAYVITDDAQTGRIISSTYQALIRGKASGTEASAITIWNDSEKAARVSSYLQHMSHPYLLLKNDITVTPTTVLSGEELTVAAGLPQQSLPGISVDTFARFGREIFRRGNNESNGVKRLSLGQIYNMGHVECDFEAFLDIDTLTAHTFVTGSTGGGKSNTIYRMLEELQRKKIPWLVIEPAKGEYKEAFGGSPDVEVYGTNPFKVPHLLKINPFSFPEDIHVLEHIDRLVEIFNACWPMYAAMPSILRESIERAYEECGWNLNLSKGAGVFPDFITLMDILPIVIDSSAYSSDTTNDYKGALITRVRALTRGIHGMVFSGDIPVDELFNHNVIIDLSRIGSQETKSLIMGALVLKLQEYRMSEDMQPNMSLRHITVLEEAHNLLKKTSSEQSQESANLTGQAVGMLSNAIAEMRTYGEGFVIADQSPGLMDMSVVRNTNTKIIMRLPDAGDRELVGRAASLNDAQIEELASLEKGVAAIYQSDWVEPVLAKIAKFESATPLESRYGKQNFDWHDDESVSVKKFLNAALDIERDNFSISEVKMLRNWYKKLGLSNKCEDVFEAILNGATLNESAQLLVVLGIAGKRVAAISFEMQIMEEIKRLFKGRYEIESDNEIIHEVQYLVRECFPKIKSKNYEIKKEVELW